MNGADVTYTQSQQRLLRILTLVTVEALTTGVHLFMTISHTVTVVVSESSDHASTPLHGTVATYTVTLNVRSLTIGVNS